MGSYFISTSCTGVTLVDQSVCIWVSVYLSFRLVCRAPSITMNTHQQGESSRQVLVEILHVQSVELVLPSERGFYYQFQESKQ